MKARHMGKKMIFGLIAVLLLLLILGAVVMLLWNALIPDLFGGPMLGYWQAVGLLFLSHILLRGAPMHGLRLWRRGRHRRWKEKFAAMTPEERAAFVERHGLGREPSSE
jgi:membrane protein implicated in regulation of membrane protease activity